MKRIEIRSLSFIRENGDQILKDINIDLNAGETLGIIGPNGGGKSTLLKIIVGLLAPTSGQILLHESVLGYLPQTQIQQNVLPITIDDALEFSSLKRMGKYSKAEILELVGLKKEISTLMTKLSGGERQRVHLACALMNGPDILVLDEPTQGLDSQGQDQLLELIQNIKKNLKTSVIIVDHNINQLIKYCDKILCLNRTQHWHNHKELLDKKILESIYHCEFEHILIHESDITKDHHQCEHDHHHDHQHHSGVFKK